MPSAVRRLSSTDADKANMHFFRIPASGRNATTIHSETHPWRRIPIAIELEQNVCAAINGESVLLSSFSTYPTEILTTQYATAPMQATSSSPCKSLVAMWGPSAGVAAGTTRGEHLEGNSSRSEEHTSELQSHVNL